MKPLKTTTGLQDYLLHAYLGSALPWMPALSDQPFLGHTVGRHVCRPCVTTERVMGCFVVTILTCSMGQ